MKNVLLTPLLTKSFISLVNSCLIYRLDISFSERAAKILGENRCRLGLSGNGEEFLTVLNGLACVAATSRSASLADELRILISCSFSSIDLM